MIKKTQTKIQHPRSRPTSKSNTNMIPTPPWRASSLISCSQGQRRLKYQERTRTTGKNSPLYITDSTLLLSSSDPNLKIQLLKISKRCVQSAKFFFKYSVSRVFLASDSHTSSCSRVSAVIIPSMSNLCEPLGAIVELNLEVELASEGWP
jgi:hypothetical protein